MEPVPQCSTRGLPLSGQDAPARQLSGCSIQGSYSPLPMLTISSPNWSQMSCTRETCGSLETNTSAAHDLCMCGSCRKRPRPHLVHFGPAKKPDFHLVLRPAAHGHGRVVVAKPCSRELEAAGACSMRGWLHRVPVRQKCACVGQQLTVRQHSVRPRRQRAAVRRHAVSVCSRPGY
jgi:hypothetical protein